MTTTVSRTIGSTGNYSTIALWWAALSTEIGGTNLVSADKIYQGQLQNQNFDLTGAALTLSGVTTDATRYVELTTVSGASFSDNASVQSNALRYNTSNGASISSTSNYVSLIDNQIDYTRINKIQLSTTRAATQCFSTNNRCTVDRCIMEGQSSTTGMVALAGANTMLSNSLFVNRVASATKIIAVAATTTTAVNCTFVVPSDLTAATYGIDGAYATMTLKNCAVFGVTNAIETGNSTFTNTTCYTSAGAITGFTSVAYDTSTGSGFQNTADATRDFRIKTGSALLDVGTTDGTNAGTDIAGTSRPSGSAYDVGAWELVQVGGAFTPNRRKLLLGAG